jgi:lipopolysaccharide biosynthesis glycosyltransferase
MHLNVALLSSNLFAPHAAATITSVAENNRDLALNFYIFTTDFKEETINLYQRLIIDLKINLEIISIPQDDVASLPSLGRWGFYALGRLLVIKNLAERMDSVLMLGADVIIEKSLRDISELDLENYAFAGAEDMSNCIKHKKRLGLADESLYINLDFYLINLKYWKENMIVEKCFDYIKFNVDKIHVGDQDVINVICNEKIKGLPIGYNMQSPYYFHEPQILNKYLGVLDAYKVDPIVIHFSEYIKPWHYECRHPLRNRYWFYLNKTPWVNLKRTFWSKRPHFYIPKMEMLYLLHNLGISKSFNFYDKLKVVNQRIK